MKNQKLTLLLVAILAFLANCSSEDSEQIRRATSESFTSLRTTSLESKMQNFQFNASEYGVFTTEKGAQIVIDGNCLMKNGNSISGVVNVEILELYERGSMLITHKPTIGKMPNEDMALLLSGGEFYINATHEGDQLEMNCAIQLVVPVSLTNGADNNMTLFCGNGWDNDCDGVCESSIIWEEVQNGNDGVTVTNADLGLVYMASFSSFGWTNVDKFYTDSRPKTTLQVAVPTGFNNTNSAVYLSYNGEPNALAYLDTFNESTGLFSEHYGQIPIGLECHVIFVSEDNGEWLYAIKNVTISDGDIISILESDLNTTNASEIETLINNLP